MGLPPSLYFGKQAFATLMSSIHTPFTALYPSARKTHELCLQSCCQISYWRCLYIGWLPPSPNPHLWMSNYLFPKYTSKYTWLSQHKSFKSKHPILMLVYINDYNDIGSDFLFNWNLKWRFHSQQGLHCFKHNFPLRATRKAR